MLISLCALSTLAYRADPGLDLGYVIVPLLEEVWRFFVAPFLFADQIGYAFVTLVATGIFGTMLERRFGPLPVVAIFVLCGAAGMAVVAFAETPPLFEDSGGFIAFGANGAARSDCSVPGSSTTAGPRAAATSARTTCSASM